MVLSNLSHSFEEAKRRLLPGTRVDIIKRENGRTVREYVSIVRFDPFTHTIVVKTNQGEESFPFEKFGVNPVIRG